ncbi:MAG TPA: response regulator [Candidatus Baltobacteraceae bacterium]|nr:response regulator [Candidatus Baltobacteraceae bacterium]
MTNRVLIVEDEAEIRHSMRVALERAGYEIEEAVDGVDGLAQFGDGTAWAAVLLDQRMPVMDGLETLRRMKARNPKSRIIMVTAYGSIELAVDAMKLGATDFVRKPTTPDILRNAVRAAVARRGIDPVGQDAAAAGETAADRPLVSSVTMNGFRFWPDPGEQPAAENTRRFIVEDPDGQREPVRVDILPAAVAQAERMSHRHLPIGGGLWSCEAEKALGTYLWTAGAIPPGGSLQLSTLDLDALDLALRWDEGDGEVGPR